TGSGRPPSGQRSQSLHRLRSSSSSSSPSSSSSSSSFWPALQHAHNVLGLTTVRCGGRNTLLARYLTSTHSVSSTHSVRRAVLAIIRLELEDRPLASKYVYR